MNSDPNKMLTPSEELDLLIEDPRPEEIRVQILLHICKRMAKQIEELNKHEI